MPERQDPAQRATRTSGTPTTCITETMRMDFLDASCTGASLDAEFGYRTDDPYAVTVVFRSDAQEVRWTFGRDLLVQGIHEPVGLGDVHLWPCLSEAGSAVVVLELSSPDGTVMVQAPTREVSLFVQRMLEAVPIGAEGALIDVEGALAELLG
jgi:hypothetical protein